MAHSSTETHHSAESNATNADGAALMRVLPAGKHPSQIVFIQTELLLVVLNFLAESDLSKKIENNRQRVALKFTKHFSQVYFLLLLFFVVVVVGCCWNFLTVALNHHVKTGVPPWKVRALLSVHRCSVPDTTPYQQATSSFV